MASKQRRHLAKLKERHRPAKAARSRPGSLTGPFWRRAPLAGSRSAAGDEGRQGDRAGSGRRPRNKRQGQRHQDTGKATADGRAAFGFGSPALDSRKTPKRPTGEPAKAARPTAGAGQDTAFLTRASVLCSDSLCLCVRRFLSFFYCPVRWFAGSHDVRVIIPNPPPSSDQAFEPNASVSR